MYHSWRKKTVVDFSASTIETLYEEGYVFTRTGRGNMIQTRSVRINLPQFSLSSENRRILKKTDGLNISLFSLPYASYHWSIAKMGKDFYEHKFGSKTFSANKIKELLTDPAKSNFNGVFVYDTDKDPVGYSIVFETPKILHYAYPFHIFYAANPDRADIGLGMMLRAILNAKERRKNFIYLGSATRPNDTYKLQFSGLEWFDGEAWRTETDELKTILKE